MGEEKNRATEEGGRREKSNREMNKEERDGDGKRNRKEEER